MQLQESIVRTILSNCVMLARRDTHDHIMVRFLPPINDVLASIDLEKLVEMAQLIDLAQKHHGILCVTSTRVGFGFTMNHTSLRNSIFSYAQIGLDLISLLMCRGTELLVDLTEGNVYYNWVHFVSNVATALLAVPTPLQSDLGLLSVKHFQKAGIEDDKLRQLGKVLETLEGGVHE